ncbi:MAG: CvpA family protein, partial [Ruminococcus sp.]
MAWYYDLVVLAILALCVWNGMRKGVSRSLLQTAATILSAVVALWVSQPLAELCYTEFLEKPVVSAVEGQLNTVDVTGLVQTALSDNGIPVSREQVQSMLADPEGTAAQYGFDSGWVNQQIDAAADSVEELTNGVLPSWLMKEIAGDGAVQKETAKSVISGDTHTAAQQLVSTYGKPILCSVLRSILFGLC